VTLGKPKERSTGSKLLTAGIVVYLVAWLVPVFQGQQLLGAGAEWARSLGATTESSSQALAAPDWLPGWGACRFAWDLLVGDAPSQDEAWKARVLGGTCLTNLVMLLAFAVFATGRQRMLIGALLLLGAGHAASWLYLTERQVFEALRPGYYLWLSSFVLVGLGALMQPPKGKP